MAGVTIGSASYAIEVDGAGFRRGLAEAEGAARSSASKIGAAFTGLSGTIGRAFSGVGGPIKASLMSAFSGLTTAARSALAGTAGTIRSALAGAAPAASAALGGVSRAVTSSLAGVPAAATASLSGVGRAVTSSLSGVAGTASSAMGTVGSAVTSALSGVPRAAAAALAGTAGAVQSALAGVPAAAQSALSGVGGAVTSALSTVTGSINTALSGVAGAVGGAFTGTGAAITGALGGIAVAAGAAGAAIAAGLGIAVKSAGDLEQAVANISTIKPDIDTSAVFKALNEMSTRVPQTAAQLGDALYNIFSSIDVSTQDALTLLEAFSKGAVGAQTDAETFGTAVLGVLNAYGLAAKDVTHISDVFFNTVNRGVVTGHELAANLGLVTQTAKAAGVSLEELGGFIAGVTKEGGPAAQNVNNLANLLNKVTTDEAQGALNNLGVATVTASGTFRPLLDILGDLKARLATMTEAGRAAALQSIFKDFQARTGAQTIISQLDFVRDAINENKTAAGSAASAYEKMSATFNSQTALLVNALRAIGTTIGAGILPFVTPLVTAFAQALPNAVERAQRAFGTLRRAFSDISSLFSGGSSGGTFEGLLSRLGLSDAAVGAVKRVVADIGNAFRGVQAALAPALGNVGLALSNIVGAASRLIVAVQPLVSLLLSKLAPAVQTAAYWFGQFQSAVSAALTFSQGHGFTGFISQLVTQLSGLGKRLFDEIVIQVGSIDWAGIWATTSSAAGALLTAVGGWVAGLATSLAGWIGTQVAAVDWGAVWQRAKDVTGALANWFVDLTVKFAFWIGEQVARIPWGAVWSAAKDVTAAMADWFLDLAVKLATWLGDQVKAIKWKDVWDNVTGMAEAMQTAFEAQGAKIDWAKIVQANHNMAVQMAEGINGQIRGADWTSVGTAFADALFGGNGGQGVIEKAMRAGWVLLRAPYVFMEPLVAFIRTFNWHEADVALAQALVGFLNRAWDLATNRWRPRLPAINVDMRAFFGGLWQGLLDILQTAWDTAITRVKFWFPQITLPSITIGGSGSGSGSQPGSGSGSGSGSGAGSATGPTVGQINDAVRDRSAPIRPGGNGRVEVYLQGAWRASGWFNTDVFGSTGPGAQRPISRDVGGPIERDRLYRVHKDELIVPSRDAYVVSVNEQRRQGAARLATDPFAGIAGYAAGAARGWDGAAAGGPTYNSRAASAATHVTIAAGAITVSGASGDGAQIAREIVRELEPLLLAKSTAATVELLDRTERLHAAGVDRTQGRAL